MTGEGSRAGDGQDWPSSEDVRVRAFEISQRPGAGTPEENWLRAEQELLAELEHAEALARAREEEAEGLRAAHWFTQSHP